MPTQRVASFKRIIPLSRRSLQAAAKGGVTYAEDHEVARCTGNCCRAFSIPNGEEFGLSPQGLDDLKKKLPQEPESTGRTDALFVADMLIYLGQHTRSPAGELTKETTHAVHFWTCKYFDKAGKKCAVYTHRPRMCRRFPGTRGCEHKACTRRTVRKTHLLVLP